MCKLCEDIDYPTAGWPWVPCAAPPRQAERNDINLKIVEALTDLTAAIDEMREHSGNQRRRRQEPEKAYTPDTPPLLLPRLASA